CARKSKRKDMNPLIRLNKAPSLFVIALLIVCPELSPKAQTIYPSPQGSLAFNMVEEQNRASTPAGGSWNIVPSPNTGSPHNYFYGVAAIASNDVWAVGGYGNLTTQAHQLIQHWDGQNWIVAPTPTLPTAYNELLAISALSSNDVWAVGSSGSEALIEHWDGTSWTVLPNPNPGLGTRLQGVSAISSHN